jgi:hypothetical protein
MPPLRLFLRLAGKLGYAARGMAFSPPSTTDAPSGQHQMTQLIDRSGRGVWKWEHYFDIYDRHFRKFVGRPVTVVEIGVMGGGSLDLWRRYFGPQATIYGVDINESCKRLESDYKILIGDQGDRAFWKSFKAIVKSVDILIDDGSHRPEDQIVTLEEMLPHLSPGGVFLCEDIHGIHNGFCTYVHGIEKSLHAMQEQPSEAQKWLSIHSYPYVTVIEKHAAPIQRLHAPKIGRFTS